MSLSGLDCLVQRKAAQEHRIECPCPQHNLNKRLRYYSFTKNLQFKGQRRTSIPRKHRGGFLGDTENTERCCMRRSCGRCPPAFCLSHFRKAGPSCCLLTLLSPFLEALSKYRFDIGNQKYGRRIDNKSASEPNRLHIDFREDSDLIVAARFRFQCPHFKETIYFLQPDL